MYSLKLCLLKDLQSKYFWEPEVDAQLPGQAVLFSTVSSYFIAIVYLTGLHVKIVPSHQ